MSQPASLSRRRDKPILSCSFCRGRKLRCDRQTPCGACAKRGRPAECLYTTPLQERKDAVDYRPLAKSQHARQRVHRLETIVTQLRDQMKVMEQGRQHASPDAALQSELSHETIAPQASLDSPSVDSMGKLSLSENHAVYTGSTHWVTILEDIQGLKDELGSEEDSEGTPTHQTSLLDEHAATEYPIGRVSLLTSFPALPKDEILALVPARKAVDRHVSHFFNAFDFASSILHRDRFLAEYSRFWDNPPGANITWVGLLFSIMTISAFLQKQDVEEHSQYAMEIQQTLETYRTLTIHCLVAGNYIHPTRHTIETLTLHFAVDQNMLVDTNIGNWMLIGVIIRIALRTGLHRDPSHWPDIRPLEAEYRRRLWITLHHMDFFTSTQVGLPRIIKDSQCDTRLPTNLFNDDLTSNMDKTPPERPLTDPTPLSFIIQRSIIIKVAAEIYDATEAGPPSSAVVATLAAKLEAAIDSIPEQSKYRPMEMLVAENPTKILHCMFMDILIHKATYLLHRRSFMKTNLEGDASESNKRCIDAALAILEHQRKMNDESQPGGIMYGIRWRVASSLNHEFLQATMMLCFALNRYRHGYVGAVGFGGLHRQQDILEALRVAHELWERNSSSSVEARRAAAAIASVLKQEWGTSHIPSKMTDDSVSSATSLPPPVTSGIATELPPPATGLSLQGFVPNTFDPAYSFDTNNAFLANDVDMTMFSNMWDDFVSDPMSQTWNRGY